ncbi:hypothetical protein Tco_0281663 [Tanacetum coccineum]
MYDKKNSVLFTDTECVVLSPDFKLLDESQVLLKVPRNNSMYSFDLKNVVPLGGTGPNWMFDIDTLTMSINYQPVFTGNQTNGNAEDEVVDDAGKKNGVLDPAKEDDKSGQGFRRGTIDKTLFIKKDKGDILLVQGCKSCKEMMKSHSSRQYVADIMKMFDFVTVKTTSTPIETNKALLKDEEAEDVDVHLYISMIGSLMYLTASRP